MPISKLHISAIGHSDRPLVASFIQVRWGSPVSVSRGRMHKVFELPGFICKTTDGLMGVITYHIDGTDCEIVTLDSLVNHLGLGTNLVHKVIEKANKKGCRRVWLITTNDNTHAIRFYQKRGFTWKAFHKNAIIESRKLKPEIPELGNDGIPVLHEIEFEYILG